MEKTMRSKTENYITLEDAKPKKKKKTIINTSWRENTRKQR